MNRTVKLAPTSVIVGIVIAGSVAAHAATNDNAMANATKLPLGVGVGLSSVGLVRIQPQADLWVVPNLALSARGGATLIPTHTSWTAGFGATGRALTSDDRRHGLLLGAIAGYGVERHESFTFKFFANDHTVTVSRFWLLEPSAAYEYAGAAGDIVFGLGAQARLEDPWHGTDKATGEWGWPELAPNVFVRLVLHPARRGSL